MVFHPKMPDFRVNVLQILKWSYRRKKNIKEDIFKKKYLSTKAFFFLNQIAPTGIWLTDFSVRGIGHS